MRLAIAMTDNNNGCEHDTTVTVDIYHYDREVQREVYCEDCDTHLFETFIKDDVRELGN